MKSWLLAAVLLILCGCSLNADTPKVIGLNAEEKKQSISLAERRMDVAFRRQKVNIEYQSSLNRLQEEDNVLNLEGSKLCFELKKAHQLQPNSQYQLDEWRGQLVKQ